jgi:hypothetical protein
VVFFDRGFIQFAGLTAGRIRSYFDINSPYEFAYQTQQTSGDSNTFRGLWGIAYTAQFGNGLSASLSFEDGGSTSQGANAGQARSRQHRIVNASLVSLGLGAETFDNEGWKVPDIVGALRIDQAWGYAQISAALHDSSGGYYGTLDTTGHPADKYGFAVSGGFHLTDVLGLKGDTFGVQVTYSEGASGYVTSVGVAPLVYSSNSSVGLAWLADGVYDTGTGISLTTVWGVNAGYQHFWNPKWRTSLYGGYTEVDYGAAATNIINSHLPGAAGTVVCGVPVGGSVQPPITLPAGGGGNACSPDFSFWNIGSRTQWNPHPDLDIGVDLEWTHLNTAYAGAAVLPASGARPGGAYTIDDQDVTSVVFRIQRNFLP